MFVYLCVVAIVAVVAGVLLAVCSKKAEGLEYGKLDKAGRITNIVLIFVYAFLSFFCMAIGIFCHPGYDKGFLRILGWIVSFLIPTAPVFSGLGLGWSVALRKKGESKKSFAVQFLGLAALLMSVLLFFVFYGNLLGSIN